MANVKDNKLIARFPVNCFSEDGRTVGELAASINMRGLMREAVAADLAIKYVAATSATPIRIEKGEMIVDVDCKGQEIAKGEIKSTVGIPPRFLDASHRATRGMDYSSKGYNAKDHVVRIK